MWTESEIADIAADAASDVAPDYGNTDHEDRIAELERENESLNRMVEAQNRAIEEIYDNHRNLFDHYSSHTH